MRTEREATVDLIIVAVALMIMGVVVLWAGMSH